MSKKIELSFYSVYSYSGIESIEHAPSKVKPSYRDELSGPKETGTGDRQSLRVRSTVMSCW